MHATGMAPEQSTIQPWLHVVLYQPEIPQNTGNIGRTCVALNAKLWIVRPTGFRLEARELKRAGLDYWEHLQWEVADCWEDLCDRLPRQHPCENTSASIESRMWLVTKFGPVMYTDARYTCGDVIVLGRETNGLPAALRDCHAADHQIALPMPGPVRSLNQATCAGIVMYEAYRQTQNANPILLAREHRA